MTKKDNIVEVSMCPSCHRLTTMKQMKADKYFCRLCRQSFKQYKNGKLIYIPLHLADAIEKTKEQLIFEFETDPQLDMGMGISFEPEAEDDLDN